MARDIADDVLDVVADLGQAVVYFLGGTDVGKTSLVIRLANLLTESRVAILDADIGQSGVLPLTISLLRAEKPFSTFSELPVVRREFIPGYNLVRHLERNARIMGELVREARGWARYCLVDTTGFVAGVGAHLKKREIEEVHPDLVVALRRSQELGGILKDLRYPWLAFRSPPWIRRKSWEERRRKRNERLSAYFQGGGLREIPRRKASGVSVHHKGRIVGLYGERFLGLGVVAAVSDEKLVVLTPVTQKVERIVPTSLTFDSETRGQPSLRVGKSQPSM